MDCQEDAFGIVNIVSGFMYRKKLVMLHTAANKLTGALLFMLPLAMVLIDINLAAIPVCVVATFAAVQEGHYIRNEKQ
ncbi:CDP-diacylglycerol--glycerol-3-phosphate 3-phosphatidyltransferase [Enterocloster clostridioformis]|uniref:CDP-diacylglycerol--glycerol-3-phosphate 3-phosphatidyltransferase n=2 Tax=Enterocloster clostridioformis TaxID=1531 RepID=A0A1I0JDI9_9FIRM|nr:hypothetical protein [Enterocloster clostridioformis]SEU08166.1 CDP-diacylglycerol--glycerol-3-phosphate 3-phosphatidyltransferase [Enterocloster clostridioformis]SEW45347.1 CDP-diacylglycerol--glycerol-3-phosphate 3-phosphatidyltransferase [Enterocloster clostridioformis]